MNNTEVLPEINQDTKKQPNSVSLLLVVLIAIVGLQAFQLNSLSKAIVKNSGATNVVSSQGTNSLFEGLQSTVGGCGG